MPQNLMMSPSLKGWGALATKCAAWLHWRERFAPLVGADPDMAEQAALLAKADLVTGMVYEAPELQGLMGRYYLIEQRINNSQSQGSVKEQSHPEEPPRSGGASRRTKPEMTLPKTSGNKSPTRSATITNLPGKMMKCQLRR